MDFENMNIWCWLIPLLTGLICGILGYLIGKSSSTTIDNSDELNTWKDENAKLQAGLNTCNDKLIAATTVAAAAIIPVIEKEPPFDANAAKTGMGKTIKKDDLKVIEGIGPKIEGMFQDGGIKTWKALSETAVARCQEILNGGGDRYKVHDPSSWPMQGKMCYEGKWTELAKWQDEHDHGKL